MKLPLSDTLGTLMSTAPLSVPATPLPRSKSSPAPSVSLTNSVVPSPKAKRAWLAVSLIARWSSVRSTGVLLGSKKTFSNPKSAAIICPRTESRSPSPLNLTNGPEASAFSVALNFTKT